MYWAFYDSKNLKTYYTQQMTPTEFAEIISPKVGKKLTASDISKCKDNTELKKMMSINSEEIFK